MSDLAAMSDSSSLTSAILNSSGTGIYIVQDGKFVYTSPLFIALSGYPENELLGKYCLDPVYPDDRTMVRNNSVHCLKHPQEAHPYEYRFIRKDGSIIWVLERITPIQYKNQRAAMGSFMDITYHKKVEEELASSEEKYRTILEQMQEGYFEIDLEGNHLFANTATLRSLDISLAELNGLNYRKFSYENETRAIDEAYNQVLTTGIPNKSFTHKIRTKNGDRYMEISISLLKDKNGKATGFRCVSRDVTERRQMEQLLEDMATHDFLTGLPNRVLLTDRFEVARAQALRNDYKLAVMSLDLDKFKEVNDTMGHGAGDEVLKLAATKIASLVRSSDTVARLGGDEFLLLLQEIRAAEDATKIAEKIVAAFQEPILVNGHYLSLSISIGIALCPNDGNDLETLIRNSDASMYYSKHHGGCQYKVHAAGDHAELNYQS